MMERTRGAPLLLEKGGTNMVGIFSHVLWRFGRCGTLIRIDIGSIIAYSKSGPAL